MIRSGARRRLAAIMFADMVGYTALMQENEEEARRQRDAHRTILQRAVESHGGDVLQHYGDGTLSIFSSAVEAVECAIEVQRTLGGEALIPLRIGVHTGDVVHEAGDVYGDGVNLASRVEGVAVPGGVAISGKVFDEIKNHPGISAVSMGTVRLKNVAEPLSVYAVSNEGLAVPAPVEETCPPRTGAAPSRRFTDEEVGALLERASELESRGEVPAPPADGPTLEELEGIAAEADMSPAALRRAAVELGMAPPRQHPAPPVRTGGLLGAPVSLQLERVVPGELSRPVLERLLPLLRGAARGVGDPVREGTTLTWRTRNPESTRTFQARVSSVEGETHLAVEEGYENTAWLVHAVVIGGLGGGVGLGLGLGLGLTMGSAVFATVVPVLALGGSYLLSRSVYAWFVRRRAEVLHGLVEDMVAVVEGAPAGPGA